MIVVDRITPNAVVCQVGGKNIQITSAGAVKELHKYREVGNLEKVNFSDEILAKIFAITGVNPEQKILPEGAIFEKLKALDFKKVLEPNFTNYEKFAEALRLAVDSGENLLVFGPGGFGKSDMMKTILKAAGIYDQTYIRSFGEDTTEAELWGGIDYKIMSDEGRMVYNIKDSFIQSEVVVMEEMLDGPINMLLSLKDTLEAGEFRKGNQRQKIKTRIVIAFTNKSPQEVEDMGEYARALMSRFRIELWHGWTSFNVADYKNMLNKACKESDEKTINLASNIFAILSRQKEISPRIAIAATKLMSKVKSDKIKEKINPLKYVTELARRSDEIDELEEKLISAMNFEKVKIIFTEAINKAREIEAKDPVKAIKMLKDAKVKIGEFALDDVYYTEMDKLRERLVAERSSIVGRI